MSVKGYAGPGAPADKPRARGTVEEEELRIRVVMELIAEGRFKSEIKKIVAAQFSMQTRSVERYIRIAFIRLRAECSKPVAEIRSESLAFYTSIKRNTKASLSDKIKAQARIDKILGVEQHGTVEVILPHENNGNKGDTSQASAEIRQFYGLRPAGQIPEDSDPATGETPQSA